MSDQKAFSVITIYNNELQRRKAVINCNNWLTHTSKMIWFAFNILFMIFILNY